MEPNLYSSSPSPSFGITPPTEDSLREIAKWGKFLAIVGFIGIALMVLAAFFMSTAMNTMMEDVGYGDAGMGYMGGGFVAFFYLLLALIYFFPVLYLYRFSDRMKTALQTKDEGALQASFANLKSLFRFLGVLTIAFLVFWVFGLLFMFLGMGIGSLMR